MRAYNFGAGPATLPESVLRHAQDEMLEWRNAGASIVELSHRGPEFMEVAAEAEADLRRLLSIPDDYAGVVPRRWCDDAAGIDRVEFRRARTGG